MAMAMAMMMVMVMMMVMMMMTVRLFGQSGPFIQAAGHRSDERDPRRLEKQ
jgi:hypothetical protein